MIIPVSSADAVLGGTVNVSNSGLAIDGFGFNDNNDFPSGTVATANGFYMVWQETNPSSRSLFFAKATGGSGTVTTPILIDSTTSSSFKFRDLHVFEDGTNVDIVGTKIVGTTFDIVHYRSTDDGVTWSSANIAASNVHSADPFWATVKGNNISIVYRDTVPFNDTFFVKSSDGGTSFASPILIDAHDGSISTTSNDNHVVEQSDDGVIVHLMYNAGVQIGFDRDIFYSRSTNSGVSFSTPTILSSPNSVSTFPIQTMIAVDGTTVTLLFLGKVGGTKMFSQIRSTDSGATFSAQENVYAGTTCEWDESTSSSQNIAIDGSTIVVTCAGIDDEGGYFGITTDMGANWSTLATWNTDPDDVSDKVNDDFGVDVDGNTISIVHEGRDNTGTAPTGIFHQAHTV